MTRRTPMPTRVRAANGSFSHAATTTTPQAVPKAAERQEEQLHGGVSIAESVVEKIAAAAARQVPGIYTGAPNGASLARALGARGNSGAEGITARIKRNREVRLEMRMRVDYGEHIPTRGEQVRGVVAAAIRELTDLRTREIKVKVTEILVPNEAPPHTDGEREATDQRK
jgi:uncharacterized alkaline shock family protein YloU